MTILAYIMMLFSIVAPTTVIIVQPLAGNQQNNQPHNRQKSTPSNNQQKPKPQTQPKAEPLWKVVLKFAGISATPSAMKASEEDLTGDLWVFDLTSSASRRITRSGGYRSP